MNYSCYNCDSLKITPINKTGGEVKPLTSDYQLLAAAGAFRFLCDACAAITITYNPADSLRKHFTHHFDLSPATQDNLIVDGKRVMRLHDKIHPLLFCALEAIGPEASFLEVACGTGELTQEVQDRFPLWNCTGIDPSLKGRAAGAGPVYIQGFFEDLPALLPGHFDAVVAHGLLNRVPTLKTLCQFSLLLKAGGLLSLDVLTLEKTEFMPYIWDHSCLYSFESLEAYLHHAGFSIERVTDCGSTWHYLCRKTLPPHDYRAFEAPADASPRAFRLFAACEAWWEEVRRKLREVSAQSQPPYALYGAGLYNSVLLSFSSQADIRYVIDDIKTGPTFWGIPVIPGDSPLLAGHTVLLCCRPGYLKAMIEKLDKNGLAWISLINETGLV